MASWAPTLRPGPTDRRPSVTGVDPPDFATERRHGDSRKRFEELLTMTDTSLSFQATNPSSGGPDCFDVSQGSSLSPPVEMLQLLMSWVDVWSVQDLNAAFESTKTPSSVDAIALTIWTMLTCKRVHESIPGVPTLYVPPHLAGLISDAISLGYSEKASMVLQYLWHGFGMSVNVPPRNVLALCQDWNDRSKWVVLRWVLCLSILLRNETKYLSEIRFSLRRSEVVSYQPRGLNTVRKVDFCPATSLLTIWRSHNLRFCSKAGGEQSMNPGPHSRLRPRRLP